MSEEIKKFIFEISYRPYKENGKTIDKPFLTFRYNDGKPCAEFPLDTSVSMEEYIKRGEEAVKKCHQWINHIKDTGGADLDYYEEWR